MAYILWKESWINLKRHGVKISRQTVKYSESIKSDECSSIKEEKIMQLIKKRNIEFFLEFWGMISLFLFINGEKYVHITGIGG